MLYSKNLSCNKSEFACQNSLLIYTPYLQWLIQATFYCQCMCDYALANFLCAYLVFFDVLYAFHGNSTGYGEHPLSFASFLFTSIYLRVRTFRYKIIYAYV